MSLKENLKRVSPVHIHIKGWRQEKAIKAEHGLPMMSLPSEAGFEGAKEIHKVRLLTVAKAAGAVAVDGAFLFAGLKAAETIAQNIPG